jgi:hypothetical protein
MVKSQWLAYVSPQTFIIPFCEYIQNLFLFFPVLGFELRAYTLSHFTSQPVFFFSFVMVFLKIGSLKLFALAGF